MRDRLHGPAVRPRRWPLFLPFGIVVVLAVGWTGFWLYAARRADAEIAAWRAREGMAGRQQRCASQRIGGFPFRIEMMCEGASLTLAGEPTVELKLGSVLAVIQAYDPSLAIGEFTGPLEIREQGGPPRAIVSWQLAQASVRGSLAGELRRASLVLDEPVVRDPHDGANASMFVAHHLELHARPAEGDAPAMEAALRLQGARAEGVHPLAAMPTTAAVVAVVHGLGGVSPKRWPTWFRDWQARGGRIEIRSARLEQADIIVSAAGTLALTSHGGLDGNLELTVVGLEKLVKALDVDGRMGATLGTLDRVMPGLGAIAGQNAGAGLIAALGQRTSLDGRPATTLDVHFADGAVFVGPFQIGQLAPLF